MGLHAGSQQYEGEDARPTSKKELRGFYIYGWASEVFVVCGMGSFIPITLEQLARERGVLASDRTTPCTAGLEMPPPGFNVTSSGLRYSRRSPASDANQCIVTILGTDINTASFAMYTFSISVLVQALLIISMSGAADHGHYRKTLLLIFATIGSIATMCFLPTVPQVILLGALFAIVANTCFGAGGVLLNSFLPLLVRHHPELQLEDASGDTSLEYEEAQEDSMTQDDSRLIDSTSALLPSAEPVMKAYSPSIASVTSEELRLSSRISSYGVGIGYLASLIVQALAITIVKMMGSTLFSLRLVVFVIGVWWLTFTIPAAFWLRPRPGPVLHLDPNMSKWSSGFAYIAYSWKSLGKSLYHARQLKDVVLFLGAWFLLSDGIATISGTAILFAKTSLEMKPAALALINIVVTLSGIIGAFAWSKLSALMNLKPIQTIFLCICILELIPTYGLLGYLPPVKALGFLGLQQAWEMYPLGAIYGFVLGGLSSFCRSLFGELIPPGFEAAFYALYAITDKGSSVFGPAVVGAIIDATGEIRPAFWFLVALIGVPLPIILMVDVERGKKDGIAMAQKLEGKTTAQEETAQPEDEEIRLVDEEANGSSEDNRARPRDGRDQE
jgi:UMF1 family MFS transporter